MTWEALVHAGLHLAVPAVVARAFWAPTWKRAWLVLVLMNLVDLDHLLATPIYDADRCSLGFHPLHGPLALVAWGALAAWRRTRLVGVGALIHMVLDGVDCLRMGGISAP